jgi:hypothetical protein
MGILRAKIRLAAVATEKDQEVLDELTDLPFEKESIPRAKRLYKRLSSPSKAIILEELRGLFPGLEDVLNGPTKARRRSSKTRKARRPSSNRKAL